MVQFKAIIINISSEEIAKIYCNKIWKLYRIPRIILSDRGPQFVSIFMEDLMKVLGTKQILLTAYHSQIDGHTKQINQEISTFLRHYVNYQKDNWLVVVEFQYNDKKHAAIEHTSFELNFG